MIKTILVDDELSALKALEYDLQKYCSAEIEVVAKCQGPIEGMKAIKKWKPQLVFLDVSMPQINGFEMLDILGEVDFDLIFVTAHDQYAIEAFNISAVHYLLKPVNPEKLKLAVQKVKEKNSDPFSKAQLAALMDNLQPSTTDKKIGLPTMEGYNFIPIADIVYCQADGNYSTLHSINSKPLVVSRPLKDIQRLLPNDQFFRVHISHLINKSHLEKYVRSDGGYVVMEGGKSLSVARSKKEAFLNWLGLKDA